MPKLAAKLTHFYLCDYTFIHITYYVRLCINIYNIRCVKYDQCFFHFHIYRATVHHVKAVLSWGMGPREVVKMASTC